MECPNCSSLHIIKNGIRKSIQKYRCKDCSSCFIEGQSLTRKIPLRELSILERYQRKFEFYKTKVDLNKVSSIKEKFKDYRVNKKLVLEIELIPSSCWYFNIRSVVKESEWDRIRFVTSGLADFKCEICGEQGTKHPTECHEVWTYNEKIKIQTLVKFQSICPLCHQVKHLGLSSVYYRYDRTVERFIKLNQISRSFA